MKGFNDYIVEFSTEGEAERLKSLAQEVYSSSSLSSDEKGVIFGIYRLKMRQLSASLIEGDRLYKNLLWLVRKVSLPEVGVLVYELIQRRVIHQEVGNYLLNEYKRKKEQERVQEAVSEESEAEVEAF